MWCIHIAVSTRLLLGKKMCFILSVSSNIHRTDSLSIAVYALASRMLSFTIFLKSEVQFGNFRCFCQRGCEMYSTPNILPVLPTQLAGAVKYADWSLQKGKTAHLQQAFWIWPKLSDSEAPVLKLWRMWSTPSLPLLLVQLWPRVVVPTRVPSMGQIEICNNFLNLKPFHCMQTKNVE